MRTLSKAALRERRMSAELSFRCHEKNHVFRKIGVDISAVTCYIMRVDSERKIKYGGIAQLGERLNGIQEVSGSIPLISTINLEIIEISRFFSVHCQRGNPQLCWGDQKS